MLFRSYEVFLVVADGEGDEERDGVTILDAGRRAAKRLRRMRRTVKTVYRKGLTTGATIFHLHDPELMPAGLKLRTQGFTVVFDAHEDLPKQLLGKHYMSKWAARPLAMAVAIYERFVCGRFDAIVTATPFIRDKFLRINPLTIDVNNFPMLEEFDSGLGVQSASASTVEPTVCYIGGIDTIRGIHEMVNAMDLTRRRARLKIAGEFFQDSVAEEVRNLSGWHQVDHAGWLDRPGVKALLHDSLAGLVTLHPTDNYKDALPVKLFEYMSAGIPVIASDFQLWHEIVERNECGLCVNPLDPLSIAQAIDYLATHPDEAARMGRNGRRAVEERYNWPNEEQKLINLYDDLLSREEHLV